MFGCTTVNVVTDERSFKISTVGLHYPVTQNRSLAINNSRNSNMWDEAQSKYEAAYYQKSYDKHYEFYYYLLIFSLICRFKL